MNMTKKNSKNINETEAESAVEIPVTEIAPSPKNKPVQRKNKKSGWQTLLLILAPIFLLAASFFLVNTAMSKAMTSAWDSYKNTEATVSDTTYTAIYDWFKKKAEEDHHVSNRTSITLGTMKKEAKLEVLRVPDTEFVIENKENNKYGITSWLKVKGTGIFTINLNLSDFIVDNERNIVTIRIPRLELEYDMGNGDKNLEKLLYKQDLHLPTFTNETKAGEEIQLRMIEEGRKRIREEIKTKPAYYFSAQEAAQEVLSNLIKSLNPERDIKVIVEFAEN